MAGRKTNTSTLLVLDWDGTLSEKDTMHVLADMGRRFPRQTGQPPPLWSELVKAYVADFEAHRSEYKPRPSERTTLVEEKAWLESLRDVELRSLQRVATANIFHDGITEYEVAYAGSVAVRKREVNLRLGWSELLAHINNHNKQLLGETSPGYSSAVVSVNWSDCFIESCLLGGFEMLFDGGRAPISDSELLARQQEAHGVVKVIANQLDLDGSTPDPSSKLFQRSASGPIVTSSDKLRALTAIRNQNDEAKGGPSLTIYIGDSTTDLSCLVEGADVGICLRDEPMSESQKELADTCVRLRIPVLPLKECELQTGPNMKPGTDSGRGLYHVGNFKQVLSWLQDRRDLT